MSDEDELKQQLSEIVAAVHTWSPSVGCHALLAMLKEIERIIEDLKHQDRATYELCELRDYVNLVDLPSQPIPDGLEDTYPIWAVDCARQALVGETELYVTPLSDIEEVEDFHVSGYEYIDRRVRAGSNTSARINVPAAWQGCDVRIIRLN